MEPQEPARNDDGSGFSKRRISSILKAPRKSVVEQQENKVEYPKPVEKRSSRRVSFAPANDVLLFSEDVKNASPARSPLEELIAASATTSQNSFQMAVAGGSQQIFGMETLLNAPLYASQQREKVNFNIGEDCGEKTVMFSADDVFLDLTHSHTINIATDAELLADIPHQNDDVLPTDGEKLMFTADNRSMDVTRSHTVNMTSGSVLLPTGRKMDISVEKKNVSSLLPCLDPEFANFIASLSKPCDPSINLMVTKVTPACSEETNSSLAPVKTKRPDVDKENQVPTFIMRKSLNRSRKTGDSSYGSALCSDDGVSKDVTEAQTGHILGSTDDDDYDDDDPFQCLFPTQEMYSQYGKRVSQTAEMLKAKQQQCSKTLVSSDHKGATTENRAPKLITEDGCRQMTDTTYLKNPVHASQRHKDNFDECSERTVMFTADNEFMDQTRSHTVTIASGILSPQPISADGLDPEFKNFFASLSNPCDCSGNPMISKMGPTTSGSSKDSTNMISSLCQLKTAQADKNKENQLVNSTRSFGQSFSTSAMCSENDESMDMTEAHTGHIRGCTGSVDPFQFLLPTQVNECLKKAEMISGQKNSEPLRSSNHKGTETSLKPSLKTKMQRHQAKFDTANDYRQKTDDACMNVTQSYTANIAADFGLQAHHNVDLLSTCGETTVMFTADATDMDMTQCLTVNIASNLVSDSVVPVKKQEGLPRNRSSSAHSLNPGFSNFLTSLSNLSDPSVDSVITRVTPPTVPSSNTGDSSNGSAKYPEGDVRIDMTEPQTGRILGMTGTDDPLQCHFPMKDKYPQSNNLERAEMTSQQLSWEALGSSNREGKEIPNQSHSVNTGAVFKPQSRQNVDLLPTCGEKTVRFFANDEAMDITQSHTVSIATACEPQLQQNLDVPTCSERTVRFSTNYAIMDMTQSHTVNIAAGFKPQSCQNLDLPTCGEKTLKFSTNDATMDITRSHTVNIATACEQQSQRNLDLFSACKDKTVLFTANDATMDVTQSHTVNIATAFEHQSHKNVDLPPCGEKTVRFTANDAAMDMTQCLAVNIPSHMVSDSVPPCQYLNTATTNRNMDLPLTVRRTESGLHRTRFSSVHGLNSGLKNSLSKTSGLGTNPVITKAVALAEPSAQEGVEANDYMEQLETQGPDVDGETLTPAVIPCTMDNPQNQIMTDCLEDDVNMGVTKAHLYPESNHMKKTEATSQQSSEALGSSNPGAVETTNQPHSSDSDEPRARKEPELRNETSPQKMEGSPRLVDQHDDILHSPKSRRKSIVSLLSKIKRLSHVINTAPDPIVMDSCTVPLPQLDHDLDQNSRDKTKSLSVVEPELKLGMVNAEDKTQAQCLTDREQTTATPFNFKTNQLMSRLSMGGFKPKLPQRSKPDDQQKVNYLGERRGTIKPGQLSNFDSDVSDIHDEELGSYEDVSETPDTSPQKIEDHSQEFIMDESLEENGFEEDFTSAARGQKRPLPEDKSIMEDEKRMKASIVTTDTTEMDLQSHAVECDANIITGPTMTTHTDCSSIRCEATFESTFKNSLFESQLEDYATDLQKKLDDGTITVSEFFKLFNIDFVIHNPRQSVLSGRLLSNTDRTLMDLFKDKHISHPKQMVYEADVQNLTKKVEGLKVRMRDLDRPLKMVNRPLWEEIRNSSEKELKPFGAKLKERNNLFRKMSKTRSHEMKEALYSNLVQPNLEVQQKLRGTIEKAEEMRKTLDDCICELETELAAVEEKGTEDKPSLKSRQEELKNITEALADSERQISELKIEKKKNSDKLCRLKAETRSMESHLDVLHTVNEYKFGGKRDNCTTYTFLYETMHLQVVYENSNGNDADNGPEQNISHITLKLELDEEKSKCHARLVHKLLSQYTEGESAWVEKYPTRRHIPQLLHDVGLVVSCCRLLGEELRLLKMWGGLRLDILDISCVDAQVQIVFSSLKKLSKFEVVFSVSLINQLYVLQLQSFKNIIGSTTMQQIEEIVALFTPGRNLLTKIVKKIHDKLLC
uniref:Knl1 C-terminal RWD domain-containing protein n=1 Tax=Monopterus albus TaxID=43700 RepID=A0A3Q3KAG7_MONAL